MSTTAAHTREQAIYHLKRNPDATPAAFAGAMLTRASLDPDTALSLYDELTDDSSVNAVATASADSDSGAATPTLGSGRSGSASGEPSATASVMGETDADAIAAHYDRLGELYAELGTIDDELFCPGNRDFTGWYRTRSAAGSWDGEGRAYALGKEFRAIRQDLERVVYATINYVPARWFMNAWDRYQWIDDADGGGREWEAGESPTPDYAHLWAFASFADIDLADEVKARRPDGEIPRELIEAALRLYIDAFADLAGGVDHVYALDSVGGAYVFIAPTATAPIGEAFGPTARAAIFEDMTGRVNEWLDDVRASVNERVPDVAGIFEPDLLNNKNRLYKAPLSVHSSLYGVVTPLDPDDPTYAFTPLESVNSALISDAMEWAAGYTGEHHDAIASIVATLWPDYYAAADDWEGALRDRVDDLTTERTRTRQHARKQLPVSDVPDDLETTDEIEVINAKIEAINVQDLARSLADEWDTDPGRDPPRFAASWHISHDSGTSCFATSEKFVDLKEGKHGGGALKLIARDRGVITHCRERIRGDDYWKAVNELRKEGYNIPYFEGSRGTHPDALRLYDEPDSDRESKEQTIRALWASNR